MCWERLLGEAMGHHPFPIPPHPPFPRRNRLWQHPVFPLLPRSSPFQTESKAKGNTRLLRGASPRLPALQSCSAPAAASRDSGVRSDGCKQPCASPCPENASGTGRRGLCREQGGDSRGWGMRARGNAASREGLTSKGGVSKILKSHKSSGRMLLRSFLSYLTVVS